MWMVAALVSAALFAGCVSSSTGTRRTAPSASTSASIVEMGKPARTAVGNTVTVHSYQSLVGPAAAAGAAMVFAAADIEACAGPNAPKQTGVARSFFGVETPDETVWLSVADVKKPALPVTLLAPNHCTRGWVTFRVPEGQMARYVVLLSTAVVKWQIQ